MLLLLSVSIACPPASLTCGSGTYEEDGECVPETEVGEETGAGEETDEPTGLEDTVETSVDTAAGDTGPVEPVDVGYPEFPENILTLSVALKTADAFIEAGRSSK